MPALRARIAEVVDFGMAENFYEAFAEDLEGDEEKSTAARRLLKLPETSPSTAEMYGTPTRA